MPPSELSTLSGDVSDVLRLAIATERKAFLHRLHIYLVCAGTLVGLARLANQLNVPALSFLIGGPTTFIWAVAGGLCVYCLYLLINQRSKAFMAHPVATGTREALLAYPAFDTLGQIPQLKVADLYQLHDQWAT